jgi:hypothetical protein
MLAVKPGDLVKLSPRKTRRGMSYDDKVGVVTSVAEWRVTTPEPHNLVEVNFGGGDKWTFGSHELVVISESR